mgnify:CR=1 FL=1
MNTEALIDRLRVIRERFTSEDTGQGFGRSGIAWAMADDLRILIAELEQSEPTGSKAEIYSRDECPFNYCAAVEICKALGKCRHTD